MKGPFSAALAVALAACACLGCAAAAGDPPQWIGGASAITISGRTFPEGGFGDAIFMSDFDSLLVENSTFDGMLKVFVDCSRAFTPGRIPTVHIQDSLFSSPTKRDPGTNTVTSSAQLWVHGGSSSATLYANLYNNKFFNFDVVFANMTAPKIIQYAPITFKTNQLYQTTVMNIDDFGYENVTCDRGQKWAAYRPASALTFCGTMRVENGGSVRIAENLFSTTARIGEGSYPTLILFHPDVTLHISAALVISNNNFDLVTTESTAIYLDGGLTANAGSLIAFKDNSFEVGAGGAGLYVTSGVLMQDGSHMIVEGNTFVCTSGQAIMFDNDATLYRSLLSITGNQIHAPESGSSGIVFWNLNLVGGSVVNILQNSFEAHFAINPVGMYLFDASLVLVQDNTFTVDGSGPSGGAAIGAISYDTMPPSRVPAFISIMNSSRLLIRKNTLSSSNDTKANGIIPFFDMFTVLENNGTMQITRNELTCIGQNHELSNDCGVYHGSIDYDETSEMRLYCNEYNGRLLTSGSCASSLVISPNDASQFSPVPFCPLLETASQSGLPLNPAGGRGAENRRSDPYKIYRTGLESAPTRSVSIESTGSSHWRNGNVQVGVPVKLLDLRGPTVRDRRQKRPPCGQQQPLECPTFCSVPTNCSGRANQILQEFVYSAVSSANPHVGFDPASLRPSDSNPGGKNCPQSDEVLAVEAFIRHPEIIFHCYDDGTIGIFTAGSSTNGSLLLWRGMTGAPDAYWGVKFECSACLPIAEAGLNPQPAAVMLFAVLKSIFIVYIFVYFSKKATIVPKSLLLYIANLKQEYWHSASKTNAGVSEVLNPEEVTATELEERLRLVVAHYQATVGGRGAGGVATATSVPPGFATFYAENLSFGGLRIPVSNPNSEVASTIVAMIATYERWIPTELDGVGPAAPQGGSTFSPRNDEPLNREDAKAEQYRDSAADAGPPQYSATSSAGIGPSVESPVVAFQRMTMPQALEEARRVLARYADTPHMQRIVLRSHAVRAYYVPPAWVVRFNAVAFVALFITAFCDAYLLGGNRYTWLYFRVFNSPITATLMASAALRALYTQRITARRLYAEPHLFAVVALLFPALFSHVLVGLIVYVWVLVPLLIVGVGMEVLVNQLCPRADDNFGQLAATGSGRSRRTRAQQVRDKVAQVTHAHPSLEHLLRFTARFVLLSSLVVALSLAFNYTQAFVFQHQHPQTSVVSKAGYGDVIGAMFHDRDARSNVCIASEMDHSVSAWWMTMGAIIGPY